MVASDHNRGRRRVTILLVVLLVAYAVLTATSVRDQSITFDELGHLTGGTAAWIAGDYRLFPQNGQFPQRLAALPLVLLGIRFPTRHQEAWRTSNLEAIGAQFLYGVGNAHESLLWRARLAMIPLALLLAWVCATWARRLFGDAGAVVTMGAFVFSPSLLAHGALATSDVAAALMFATSLGGLWLTLHRAGVGSVAASTAAMGLLFATKMSAWLMVPIAIVLVLVRLGAGRPLIWSRSRVVTGRWRLLAYCGGILVLHAAGVVLVIWTLHGFRYSTFADEQVAIAAPEMFLGETIDTLATGTLTGPAIRVARDLHVLPEPYLFGLAHVLNRSDQFVGFLNGRYRIGGWWYFFPYCWLIKTPLSMMALLLFAAGVAVFHAKISRGAWRRVRRWTYRLMPLGVLLIVYSTAAISSGLNVGERHLLPIYPALFILAGAAGLWLRSNRGVAVMVGVCLVGLAVESLRVWPHSLSFVNVIGGGPTAGYRRVVDSSFDWGQDLPALTRWLEQAARDRTSSGPVYLSYFGSGNPEQARLNVRQLYSYQDWRLERPFHELTGGTYCISATMLQSVYTIAVGPWAVPYEDAYQRARLTRPGNSGESPAMSRASLLEFEQLRLGRLAAYLRRREPDARAGYSILIYRLSDEDIQRALAGPPVELWPEPQVERRGG